MAANRGRDIVVVAASAGGIEALRGLLSQLPATVPAALLVVLHVPAAGGKVLPGILARSGHLPASAAADGETPLPGHVYVAPPDRHILLVGDKIRLSQGPRHNGHRPAADPLFISAALSGGPHTIAVVLSGTLDEGAAGAGAGGGRGGVFPEPVPPPAAQPSPWSGVTCPECGGPLVQEEPSVPARFECQAGHAWSAESLLAAQAAGIERALWAAVLRLEERARLHQVLAETAEHQGYPLSAGGFRGGPRSARSAARQLRRLLGLPAEIDIAARPDDE